MWSHSPLGGKSLYLLFIQFFFSLFSLFWDYFCMFLCICVGNCKAICFYEVWQYTRFLFQRHHSSIILVLIIPSLPKDRILKYGRNSTVLFCSMLKCIFVNSVKANFNIVKKLFQISLKFVKLRFHCIKIWLY